MSRKSVLFVIASLFLASMACQALNIEGESLVPTLRPLGTAVQVRPTSAPEEPAAPEPTAPIVVPPAVDRVSQQATLVDIYNQISPGVVSIQVISTEGGGQGSGFVVDQDGHIITNYHVVEGATDLEVHFPSGFKAHAEIIGEDLDSDIAVVMVDAPPEELHPLPFGNSDSVEVGQTVIAIGNPFGLSGTMTVGIISARGRTLDSLRESPGGQFFSAGDILQTDAAINPGNSGGPLLNLNGEVIGVNRAIRTETFQLDGTPTNAGIGFAIPVNIVSQVLPVLIETGEYSYPYLGISSLPDLSLRVQEALDLPQATGAYVTLVTPGSPADRAGVRGGDTPTEIPGLNAGGDLIVAIDGMDILEFGELLSYLLNNKRPGDTVVLTVLRDGETVDLELTLGERP